MGINTPGQHEKNVMDSLDWFLKQLPLSPQGGQFIGVYSGGELMPAEAGEFVIAVPKKEIRILNNHHHPTGQFSVFVPVRLIDQETGAPHGDELWCETNFNGLPSCVMPSDVELPFAHRFMTVVLPGDNLKSPDIVQQEYEFLRFSSEDLSVFLADMID